MRSQTSEKSREMELSYDSSSTSCKNSPPFNPLHLARLSRYRYENCLAYALNHNLEGPEFYPLTHKKYLDKNKAINFVVESLNSHFEDKELTSIAPNEKGKLPTIKENYYIVAFLMSYANEKLNQKFDYHFLVQNNDGMFSHRRGQGKPEKTDSNGCLIRIPEENTFYYKKEFGELIQADGSVLPCTYNYKFISYLYVKPLEKRNQKSIDKNIEIKIADSEFTDKKWERLNNFAPRDYINNVYPLDRVVYYKNKYPTAKIKKISIMGYIKNHLRIIVDFKHLDHCNEFLNHCPQSLIDSKEMFFNEETLCIDPISQQQFDMFLKLIAQYDALDKSTLQELPIILGIPEFKENSNSLLKGYPIFNPDFSTGGSFFSNENCLSYALSIKNGCDHFNNTFGRKPFLTKEQELKNAITCLNLSFEDKQFALVTTHEPGKLPSEVEGYYLIALLISHNKGFNSEKSYYQESDYHFVVQNSDGYFSHRRGQGNSPERYDSDEKLITNPENANFFYKSQTKVYDNDKEIPVCYDYKFIGYLHVKTVAQRRKNQLPMDILAMLNSIEKQVATTGNLKEEYSQLRQKYFVYPPLIQYFEDARKDVVHFYHQNKMTLFSQNGTPAESKDVKMTVTKYVR